MKNNTSVDTVKLELQNYASIWINPNHPQSNKIQQGEVKKMR